MREAGFIILGTTNVPEALTWYESYNKVYGRGVHGAAAKGRGGGAEWKHIELR